MHFTLVASILSLAVVSHAQFPTAGGIGRFQCSRMVNGVSVPDQTLCSSANIAGTQIAGCEATGANAVTDGGFKNDGAIPSNSICFQPNAASAYFCGVAGAACTTNANCDNGQCEGGVCTGAVGYTCAHDAQCTGNVYCSNAVGTIQGQCGFTRVNPAGTAAANIVGGSYCGDTQCGAGPFLCTGPNAICDTSSTGTGECYSFAATGATARARARRDLKPRSRCPATHSVCPTMDGSNGFECIDTQSNLEQCGACASQGGVDCTAIPGVDAVGCVAGQCEIWACAESHVWDATTASCKLALVA